MQHFGLYFDEWNEKGLGRMPSKGSNRLDHGVETDSIIDSIVQAKKEDRNDPADDKALERLSQKKAVLAGILTAIKELSLNDFLNPKNSVPHPRSC